MTAASAVFDASAVVRAVVNGSAMAVAALDRADRRLAPDLLYAESTNTLMKYCRSGVLAPGDAATLLEEILALPLEIRPARSLAAPALTVALERGISAYDACYVALAEAADAPLVTADRRLAAAYEGCRLIV